MSGRIVLIFIILTVVTMSTFNCTSIQKKYTPLGFWYSREFPEQIDETSSGAKTSGLMTVDMKEPTIRNSIFEGNARYFFCHLL